MVTHTLLLVRRSITSPLWLAAATFALGCASTGAPFAEGPRPSTSPRTQPESEASLTVRLENILTTDRFIFLRAEVYLDQQPVPLVGPPSRTTLAAGAHALRVVVVYNSANSVPPSYRYRVISRHAFTVANGETREIVVRVLDDGNPRPFDAFSVTFDGVPGT
jgi:hypothetical protein